MKTLKIIGKIVLSFIILFLLYTIHFFLDEFVFKKQLSGNILLVVEIISAFIWSFIGGVITVKITPEIKIKGPIYIATLTGIYMMLNYPSANDALVLFWISLLMMVLGILLGGLFAVRKTQTSKGLKNE